MNSPIRFILLAGVSTFLAVSCQQTGSGGGRNQGGGGGMVVNTGPVAAYADVEVFGEHPLTAFQRTGQQPLPITSLNAGTPLNLTGRSGAFFQMILQDGSVAWIATRDVAGNVPRLPDVVPGSRPMIQPGFDGSGQGPTNPNGGMTPGPGQDKIDLDRLGGW